MPLLFKSKESRRRDELRDILDLEVTPKKGKFHTIHRFIIEHYRIILITLFAVISLIMHIYYFNTLTVMKQRVINTRAQIESALQMRQNIIPALTTVVYQFINHEKNIFISAVVARENSLTTSKDLDKLTQALKGLTGEDFSSQALSKFLALAENYPQLVSSESYQLLISQIADVENQIYQKRIEYNDEVNRYNTRLSVFPVNILGRMMRFRLQPYFEWGKGAEWVFLASPEQGELPVSMKLENSKGNKVGSNE